MLGHRLGRCDQPHGYAPSRALIKVDVDSRFSPIADQLTTGTVTRLFLSQISGYLVAALGSSVISHTLGPGGMMLLAAGLLTTATLQLAHFGEQNRGGLSSAAVYVTIA